VVGESVEPDVGGIGDGEGVCNDAPTWAGSTLVLAAAVRADDIARRDGAVAEPGLGVGCGVDGRGGAIAPDAMGTATGLLLQTVAVTGGQILKSF